VEVLRQRITADGLPLDDDLQFLDDGHSGSTLLRPALERLRDQAAAGALDRLYVLAPDRLARNFALQYLLVEEFRAAGVEVVFVNRAVGESAEDNLLLQVQGVIAEYERAKIAERARRGKHYAARQGRVSVLSQAPFGYRYVRKAEGGGAARFDVVLEEARVVRQVFAWVGQERLSLREVCRRLQRQGVVTRTGKPRWDTSALAHLLRNTAYIGEAHYGKTRVVPRRAQLRPRRHQPHVPRRPYSISKAERDPVTIAVPALVSAELFAQAGEQLEENRRRARARRTGAQRLLQGLVVCRCCGYACTGVGRPYTAADGARRHYSYYRCGGRGQVGGDGQKVCRAPTVAADELEAAVWTDLCALLEDPARVEQEYQRRFQGAAAAGAPAEGEALGKRIATVKRGLSRLIDAYGDGLLEREEFEPRVRATRERLARLEAEAQAETDAVARREELRLVLGQLQEFAEALKSGIREAPWDTRRQVIQALVKQIEVSAEDIRIVYRVPPVPFVERPEGGVLQDCGGRLVPVSWPDRTQLRRCLLLCDRVDFQRALVEASALRFVGRDYMAVCAPTPYSFHPKIWLMIGADEAALLVGSGNLTQSGFTTNLELFDAVQFAKGGPHGTLAGDILLLLDGLRGLWAGTGRDGMLVLDTLAEMREAVEGLGSGMLPEEFPGMRFLTSFGGPLLGQFRGGQMGHRRFPTELTMSRCLPARCLPAAQGRVIP
jgi:site-specific DNA recombinase